MGFDELAGDVEAEAYPATPAPGFRAMEALEDVGNVLGVDPASAIRDGDDDLALPAVGSNIDGGLFRRIL